MVPVHVPCCPAGAEAQQRLRYVGGHLLEGEAVIATADFSVVKCFAEEKGFFFKK